MKRALKLVDGARAYLTTGKADGGQLCKMWEAFALSGAEVDCSIFIDASRG